MTINRRSWLYLSGAALCGCKDRQESASREASRESPDGRLQAGPFSVDPPVSWQERASVEKIPIRPLYTAEEWQFLQTAEHGDIPPAIYKPHFGIRPRHWAVRLPAALPPGISVELEDDGNDPNAPQILIHKADEWAAIQSDGVEGREQSPQFIRSLREKMDAEIAGEETDFVPAFMDAHLGFRCLKRRLDFDGGHGVRMLAQWLIEPELLRKNRLHYLFIGMSDDDTCQIIATFPVNLPGLPEEYPEEDHLGHNTARFGALTKGFDAYEKEAMAWLEQYATEINPSLETLDTMLKSLVVRRWE